MTELKTFAPVLIPTLCRYEHLKRCVESLARCTHAEKTDLIIAFDYPAKDEHWDGYNKIKNFLPKIDGFNNLEIILRTENLGVPYNRDEARSKLYDRYDKVIFTEDDNEFSPNFLEYMNKGLEKFKHDENVFTICGLAYPMIDSVNYPGEYIKCHRFCASGYGVTRGDYEKLYFNIATLNALINISKNLKQSYKLLRYDPFRFSEMLSMIGRNACYPDFFITAHMIVHDMFCVFPQVSLVRNHGYDGSGVNSLKQDSDSYVVFAEQPIDSRSEFCFGAEPSQSLIDKFELGVKKEFKCSIQHYIWIVVRYMIYRLTGKVVFLDDRIHSFIKNKSILKRSV